MADDQNRTKGPAGAAEGPGPDWRQMADAAWGYQSPGESRLLPIATAVTALVLYVALPDRFLVGPRFVVPALEAAVLVPLVIASPNRITRESRNLRGVGLTLIGLINAANIGSLVLLVHHLLHGGTASGQGLIYGAIAIWVTNVLVFALWFWEIDRGGPVARCQPERRHPDFLFPQMGTPQCAPVGWVPSFFDYLWVSFTNASAFSPTDVMPLTTVVKMAMLVEAATSLTTIAVVAARAVNILH
jgi:hypothetical protein